MRRNLCTVIGLGALMIGPALPDVVDVTVNGSLSGSGGMTTECTQLGPNCVGTFGMPPLLETVPYSYSATNTQLGTAFDTSGEAVGTAPGAQGALDYHAFQEVTATADNLDIALEAGQMPDGVLSWDGTATQTISLGFELTEESVIQLDVSPFGPLGTNSGDLLDSHGNVILNMPFPFGSTSAVLAPGTYYMDASASGSANGFIMGDGNNVEDFAWMLNSTFTPVATPEPPVAFFAALLAMMLGGYEVSRRRRAA
jgi:hypothetical protein